MDTIKKLLFHTIAVLFLASLQDCKAANGRIGFPTVGISTDDLLTDLSGKYEQMDTTLYWSQYTFDLSYTTKSPDTVFRFGPFSYKGFPGILLARVANGKIARYDIVYDQYIVWKYPMIKLGDSNALKLHQESDSAYWKLRYRENSDSEEFSRIFSAMKAEYGEPDSASSISDKIYLWKRKHIALRSLDNGRTTIVSFFGNLDKPYIESDWQFSSIYLDSTLVKIPLGSDKQELKSIFHFRDTVVDELTPNVTQGTIEQWSWGIPGKLTFTFDSTNKLIHFVWEGVGIGSTYFLRTFVAIDLMLRALLREDIETKKVKEGEVRIRWHSLFYGDILIIYYDPLNFAFYKMEPKLADSYMEN